jgi:hypothetical protein
MTISVEPFPLPDRLREAASFLELLMTDNQASMLEKKRPGRRIALVGAGATALAIFNMWGDGEAPSLLLLILEYIALALGLFALVGGLIMMARQR